MNKPVLLTETDARGVATVTFNRAHALNTYNDAMIAAAVAAFSALDSDDTVRVVLLRGAGKHFCAGADIKAQGGAAPGPATFPDALQALDRMAKPTVALVHKGCIGGGAAWACCCDIVVASQDAFFSIPEVRLGFSPAALMPIFIAAMGERQAGRYALSGERFDAAEAHRIGLVHEVCPEGGLDEAAAPIVEALLAGGPVAIAETKRLIADIGGVEISEELAQDISRRGEQGRASDEAAEGRAAFKEKRKPAWYPQDT